MKHITRNHDRNNYRFLLMYTSLFFLQGVLFRAWINLNLDTEQAIRRIGFLNKTLNELYAALWDLVLKIAPWDTLYYTDKTKAKKYFHHLFTNISCIFVSCTYFLVLCFTTFQLLTKKEKKSYCSRACFHIE